MILAGPSVVRECARVSNPTGLKSQGLVEEPVVRASGATLATRIRERGAQAVAACIPEQRLQEGGESLRRARVVIGFTLMLVLLSLEAGAFFHWVLPSEATVWLDGAMIVGLGLLFAVPWVLRKPHREERAANLVITACFVVLVTIFLLLGGIRAPVLHWCALLPMLAVLMGARRSAWAWSAAAIGTLVGLALVEVEGVAIPSYLAESGLTGGRLWVQRVVDVGSWIGILLAMALIYERRKDQQAAELRMTNAELKREVAQRRRAEQRTHYLAYHDELTELPNRQLFKEKLERAIALADQAEWQVGVMFLDLDGFKEVNDTYGHRLGDILLQQVAERLRSCVRNADSVFRGAADGDQQEVAMVSRLGGDEFTVLLVKLRDEQEAGIVARRILGALESPFSLEGERVHVTASIGIALYPQADADVNVLLRNADLAMYSAKERGKNNYQFFSESMNAVLRHRTTLASELREAKDRGEFVLYYQPIVHARTHAIVALEALLRWQHPTRGLLLPREFVQIAEETGAIVSISQDVLWRATQQVQRWHEAGLPPVRIAVNISGVELRDGGLGAHVSRVLRETGLDPKYLELEITESAMMEDEEEAALSLGRLKELGVQVTLDDFGTGYSSLSYVQRYPVDSLKIDHSFVRNVVTDPDAQAITTAIVALAHGLQLDVVAEGVETEEQELFLRDLGCDHLQGFRFSVPRSAHEIPRLLEDGVLSGKPL